VGETASKMGLGTQATHLFIGEFVFLVQRGFGQYRIVLQLYALHFLQLLHGGRESRQLVASYMQVLELLAVAQMLRQLLKVVVIQIDQFEELQLAHDRWDLADSIRVQVQLVQVLAVAYLFRYLFYLILVPNKNDCVCMGGVMWCG